MRHPSLFSRDVTPKPRVPIFILIVLSLTFPEFHQNDHFPWLEKVLSNFQVFQTQWDPAFHLPKSTKVILTNKSASHWLCAWNINTAGTFLERNSVWNIFEPCMRHPRGAISETDETTNPPPTPPFCYLRFGWEEVKTPHRYDPIPSMHQLSEWCSVNELNNEHKAVSIKSNQMETVTKVSLDHSQNQTRMCLFETHVLVRLQGKSAFPLSQLHLGKRVLTVQRKKNVSCPFLWENFSIFFFFFIFNFLSTSFFLCAILSFQMFVKYFFSFVCLFAAARHDSTCHSAM